MPPLLGPGRPPSAVASVGGLAAATARTGLGLVRVAVALPDLVVRAERALTRLEPVVAQVGAASQDGSLQTGLAAAGRADRAVDAVEGLPAEIRTLRTELRGDLQGVAAPLAALHDAALPLLARLTPAVEDLLRLQEQLQRLVDDGQLDDLVAQARRVPALLAEAERLASWASDVTNGADASVVPELLDKVDRELLPVLVGLGDTQADVVALREAVERLVSVMDSVGSQLATLPGASLLRRRAARDEA